MKSFKEKIISRKAQIVLSFIPAFNLLVVGVWGHNWKLTQKKRSVWCVALLIIFFVVVGIVFLDVWVERSFEDGHLFLSLYKWLVCYFGPMVIGLSLIGYQKHLGIG